MLKSTRPEKPWGYKLEDWEQELTKLKPELAQQIRTATARAGLQAHDPAARMIGEMWVAVAALRDERRQLQQKLDGMRQEVRNNQRYLQLILALLTVLLLLIMSGWLC